MLPGRTSSILKLADRWPLPRADRLQASVLSFSCPTPSRFHASPPRMTNGIFVNFITWQNSPALLVCSTQQHLITAHRSRKFLLFLHLWSGLLHELSEAGLQVIALQGFNPVSTTERRRHSKGMGCFCFQTTDMVSGVHCGLLVGNSGNFGS